MVGKSPGLRALTWGVRKWAWIKRWAGVVKILTSVFYPADIKKEPAFAGFREV